MNITEFNQETTTRCIDILYHVKPVQRELFTADYLLGAYKEQKMEAWILDYADYSKFIKDFIISNSSAMDHIFHFLNNKVYDVSVFAHELIDICRLYGENISLKAPAIQKDIKFSKVDVLTLFDPDNINLILTDEKEVKRFKQMLKSLNVKNQQDFKKDFKRGSCHQNLKIDKENYFKLINYINIENHITFNKTKVGVNWYRTKTGESFLEVKDKEFISTRTPNALISFEQLLTKKPILLGRVTIFTVNGFTFILNQKLNFLTNFFIMLANVNNDSLKQHLDMFDGLSKVMHNLSDKEHYLKQTCNSIKNKSFKTNEELARMEEMNITLKKITKSIEYINATSTHHREAAKKFVINRDVALLALGKYKSFLPSFQNK